MTKCINIYIKFQLNTSNKYFNFEHSFPIKISTQSCFFCVTENWKQSLDEGGHYGAPLADLSKAIDCIMHDLLTAKLQEYDFDNNSLNFIFNIC